MFKYLTKAYQFLIFFGGLLKSPILLLLRLCWGWLFMVAGWEKLNHISQFAELLDQHHFFSPYFLAYLTAICEFVGGICLILGFASRFVAIPLAIITVTAYYSIHTESLHKLSLFVSEAPFNFLVTALVVLAFGPGRFSVDYMLERWLFSRAEDIPKHQHLP